jgi:hypothetical protein
MALRRPTPTRRAARRQVADKEWADRRRASRRERVVNGRASGTGIAACLFALSAITAPVASAECPPSQTASYLVQFNATWSAATHPLEIPPVPHFSPLIGGTHDATVAFWAPGSLASAGIEMMAEVGASTPLDTEIQTAITAGQAGVIISGGGINPSPGSVSTSFSPSQTFPLVTLVTMIAPSPDWFVGVRGLALFENGDWVQQKVASLSGYDAGTDDGVTFLSADDDSVPAENISLITTPPLGGTPPLGSFTFTRLDSPVCSEIPSVGSGGGILLGLLLLASAAASPALGIRRGRA